MSKKNGKDEDVDVSIENAERVVEFVDGGQTYSVKCSDGMSIEQLQEALSNHFPHLKNGTVEEEVRGDTRVFKLIPGAKRNGLGAVMQLSRDEQAAIPEVVQAVSEMAIPEVVQAVSEMMGMISLGLKTNPWKSEHKQIRLVLKQLGGIASIVCRKSAVILDFDNYPIQGQPLTDELIQEAKSICVFRFQQLSEFLRNNAPPYSYKEMLMIQAIARPVQEIARTHKLPFNSKEMAS